MGCSGRPSVAGPPSPHEPGRSEPATVSMAPAGVIRRTRWLLVSEKNTVPSAETATPKGLSSLASVAQAPSGEKPRSPVPTRVVMMPLVSTLRMVWLALSAKYMLPSASKWMATGLPIRAREAGPPSPE